MNAEIHRQLKRNESRTVALAFFRVFLVIVPIAVPFFQSRGLTMQDVFLLQALFSIVVVAMEVPSGYIADVIGRKRTLVVGCLFIGIGHSFLLIAQGFSTLALFEISLGIGASLASGADLALLYDTERALAGDAETRQRAVSRLYSTQTFSEAIAGVACSVLLLWSMQAVVVVQVLVGWIPVLVALGLVEPPGARLSRESHLGNVRLIVGALLRDDAVLRLTFLTFCIWSLTTFYAVWILQKLWELEGIGLQWYGYLWAGLTLIAAISGRFAHYVEERVGTTALLITVGLAPVLGYAGLAGFGALGGLLASVTFFVSRGLGLVVLKDALNRRIASEYRATANSLASFGFRSSFVVTGPWVGYVLDLWGMQTTLWLLAVGSLVIFGVLVVPLIVTVRTRRARADYLDPLGAAGTDQA